MAVEHDCRHTEHSHQGSRHLDRSQAQRAIEQAYEQRGEHGTAAHDERGVGGRGVVHRRVLGQEVQGAARQSQRGQQQLVLPRVCPAAERPAHERECQQQHVGDDEAQREDLSRRKPADQQNLGAHERASPDGYHQECREMIYERVLPHDSVYLIVLFFFRKWLCLSIITFYRFEIVGGTFG